MRKYKKVILILFMVYLAYTSLGCLHSYFMLHRHRADLLIVGVASGILFYFLL